MILTTRLLMDSFVPIILLILISLVTPRGDSLHLARFYARLKTPVGATPVEEAAAIALSEAEPTRFDHTKLFPDSEWEFTRWDRSDLLGFMSCCAFVIVVLIIFKGLLSLGT